MIERKGVVYFPTFVEARDFGSEHGRGFPAWRVVSYGLGWAIQVRPSGSYFDASGKPSTPPTPEEVTP